MIDFFEAGGVLAVEKELAPLLQGDVLTVAGRNKAEVWQQAPAPPVPTSFMRWTNR